MKLDPFGFVDLVLGYISPEYAPYHKIPEGFFQALNYVISIIRKSAVMFKEKILYNQNILKIVFISSEESVTPLLGDSSHTNRCVKLMEIENISDAEAIN